jgi:hypothetical protein
MTTQLLEEAAFVGVTFIPFQLAAESFISNRFLATFAAGAAYHIAAETLGINEWYLNNSYAARKLNDKACASSTACAATAYQAVNTSMVF